MDVGNWEWTRLFLCGDLGANMILWDSRLFFSLHLGFFGRDIGPFWASLPKFKCITYLKDFEEGKRL